MSNKANRVTLCGIPWHMATSEGMVVFNHIDGFYGIGIRIAVYKLEPCGLLQVECDRNGNRAGMAACHIAAAVKKAAEILGPDHFVSNEAKKSFDERKQK